MKTIYFAAASLDGYIADKNDSLTWLFKNGPTDISFIDEFVQTIGKVMPGADVRFVKGDIKVQHQELRKLAGNKNIWIMGGGDLAGQFHEHGLIDEMHIQTVAVFLNEGKKLFARRTEDAFKIKEIRQRGDTCVEVIYNTKNSN